MDAIWSADDGLIHFYYPFLIMPENFHALENEKDRSKSLPESYHALESGRFNPLNDHLNIHGSHLGCP